MLPQSALPQRLSMTSSHAPAANYERREVPTAAALRGAPLMRPARAAAKEARQGVGRMKKITLIGAG